MPWNKFIACKEDEMYLLPSSQTVSIHPWILIYSVHFMKLGFVKKPNNLQVKSIDLLLKHYSFQVLFWQFQVLC